jgi:hypothetical protein
VGANESANSQGQGNGAFSHDLSGKRKIPPWGVRIEAKARGNQHNDMSNLLPAIRSLFSIRVFPGNE